MQQRFFSDVLFHNLKVWHIIMLYLFPLFFSNILDFGGKSIGESFALVMLGYYIFSDDELIERLKEYCGIFHAITFFARLLYTIIFVWMRQHDTHICTICSDIAEWCGILGFLGFGKRVLNKTNRLTRYMIPISFQIYIFHFAWMVCLKYLLGKCILSTVMLYAVTVIGTLVLTLGTVKVIKRIPMVRVLFGMKSSRRKE